MLSLTRLFLHHWHRYYSATLDVDSGLCLTGPDEADAAAVLDALQLALVGDPARLRFHTSRYGFTHDLDSYARGRLTEDKWQRPGNTVSYVIIEFTHTLTSAKTTHGLCIETGPRLPIEITWFSLAEGLNPATFVTKGRPLPRIELKPLLRNWRGARYFEKPHEYQSDLLNILGGLDESFFDLFQRALHFQPARRVEDFVNRWFLDEAPLDLSLLRRMRERLGQLHTDLERAETQLAALQPIVRGQADMRRLADLRDGQTLLIALLRSHAAQRRVAALDTQITALQAQISESQARLANQQSALSATAAQLREAERREFESGLGHRKSVLEWQHRYSSLTADHLRQRWARLARQLRAAGDGLRPLTLGDTSLTSDERLALHELINVIDAATATERLAAGEPPPPALAAALNAIVPTLLSARDRLIAQRTHLADQVAALQSQLSALQSRLNALTAQPPNPPTTIPPHIARMQDLLAPVIGKKPPLLFEFIEVTEPRWQNAVEAILGPARFHAIVSGTWHTAARAAINKARAAQQLAEADVHDPTQLYNRAAQPGSLATKVSTIYPDLRAYLDTVLGDIICVETPDDFQDHYRAITPDCAYHSTRQGTATLAFEEYQPVVIGQNAGRIYTETRQRHIASLQTQLSNLNLTLNARQAAIGACDLQLDQLAHAYTLAVLRESLNAPLDERPARAEAAGYEAELRTLDQTPLVDLKAKADGLRAAFDEQTKARDEIIYKLAALELELRSVQGQMSVARMAQDESKAAAASARAAFPQVAAAADEALPPHLTPDDLSSEIRLVEQKEKDFDKKYRDERLRVIEALAAFNAVYQLAPWPGDPDDARYAEAAQRLAAAELPRLQRDIASAEHELDDELRDHIVRPLRQHLMAARRTFDQINETLSLLNSPYRLAAEPVPDTADFYGLILDTAANPQAHTQTLSSLYDVLTTHADPRLSDYRGYLQYAIEVSAPDGSAARIVTADGEAQLAFYGLIAASFARLYRIRSEQKESGGRPCLRLIPFGQAFARMEAGLIGPALELFKRLGLQVAAAAPLERSDYLITALPTVIVLTPVKEIVLPEPYRNYNALKAADT